MAYYNIYFSPTGGTKRVAEILVKNLCKYTHEIDLCKESPVLSLTKEDVCILSVPSFGGRVPEIAIKRLAGIKGNGAKVILNCVYGNREWEDTLVEMQDTMEDLGFRCIAAIAAVAEHSIFRQFATGRPDRFDEDQLADFCIQIKNRIESGIFPQLILEGNHGNYKVFHGTPFKPLTNESCSECGLCAKECPVGAIDIYKPKETDRDKCISCMRCIAICPKKARKCDQQLLEEMGKKMTPVLEGYKKNHLFL